MSTAPAFRHSWRRRVGACVTLTLALSAASASAATPEQLRLYFAKKEAMSAVLTKLEDSFNEAYIEEGKQLGEEIAAENLFDAWRRVTHLEKQQLLQLQGDLIGMLGDQPPPGFSAGPEINLFALERSPDRRPPDSLVYRDKDGKATVAVTPLGIFENWLWRPRLAGRTGAQLLADYLNAGGLHLRPLPFLGWRLVAVRLPVTVPAGATQAFALVVDNGYPYDTGPDEIGVFVVGDDRVHFGNAVLQVPLPRFFKCTQEHNHLKSRGRDGDDEMAQAAFMACYTKAVRGRPELARALAQAQALVDRLRPPSPQP